MKCYQGLLHRSKPEQGFVFVAVMLLITGLLFLSTVALRRTVGASHHVQRDYYDERVFNAAEGGANVAHDWLTTLLLAIFVGWLGIHRFYTGHTLIGIVQLLTCGVCGIWTLIDIIMIATGSFKDKDGSPLAKN